MKPELACPRCAARIAMIIRDETPAFGVGCAHCGFRRYPQPALLGKVGIPAADEDMAAIIRRWAKESGLDWEDRAVTVGIGEGGASVSVEGEPEFAERWAAAFAMAMEEYNG